MKLSYGRYNMTMFHDGPAQVWMSKAPAEGLESYVGDQGDWFKIAFFGAETNKSWIIDDKEEKNKISDVCGCLS